MRQIGSLWGLAVWLLVMQPVEGEVPRWVSRVTAWLSPELREVEKEIVRIDRELELLAKPAEITSGVRKGFQTSGVDEGEEMWISLTFPEPVTLDRVVMVPLLAKGASGPIPGYGFPRRFQLELSDEDGDVVVLMDETGDDFPNPGFYPVSVACPHDVMVQSIRLRVMEAGPKESRPVMALAEVMALSGNKNLAPTARVRSSKSREIAPTWGRSNLTDMETALGFPVSPHSSPDRAGWHSEVAGDRGARKSVTVDLGRFVEVDELRIAPAWRPDSSVWSQYGFPSRFFVEVASEADFGDARMVEDQRDRTVASPGQSLLQLEVGGPAIRFIRMTTTRLRESSGEFLFALGELQAYAGDENVAAGAAVVATESREDAEWGAAALTDGMAGGGRMIELPDWISELEQRRQLEERRTVLVNRSNQLLEDAEHTMVFGSVGATCGIAAFAVLVSWRSKRQRKMDRERHRERLAQDLHDELGSNLGSIALISSFALEGDSDETQMREDFAEIETVARESADSMRDMVELLGGGRGGAANDWLGVMEGMAERLLRGMKVEFRLPDGPLSLQPDLETRRELYLFCKEVLHNIVRHSGASEVDISLRSQGSGLEIVITDNGRGFDPTVATSGQGLGNLRQRVKRLKGKLDLASAIGGPTVVHLDGPRGKRWRKPDPRKEAR